MTDKPDVTPPSTSKILAIYLWEGIQTEISSSGKMATIVVDPSTGGTASEVFVSNVLCGLNDALHDCLHVGLIPSSNMPYDSTKKSCDTDEYEKEKHDSLISSLVQEFKFICSQTGATEIFYLQSHDSKFESTLKQGLKINGLIPHSFPGGYSLLDYTDEKVQIPWKDIVLNHPFRSPLIPFVDYLLETLKSSPPSLPKDKPKSSALQQILLSSSITGSNPNIPESSGIVTSSPLDLDKLVQSIGRSGGGTNWGSNIAHMWGASEMDAHQALAKFLDTLKTDTNDDKEDEVLSHENKKKTHLASCISPHLARGTLSPRQVYYALKSFSSSGSFDQNCASFLRRICWRDYTYAINALFPDVVHGKPIREGYEGYEDQNDGEEYENSAVLLEQWKEGMTGYPLVDAGMRQLKKTGWMPQKVRLAVSTCLVEGLGVSWRSGMQHFAEYLVDYDVAINSNMWMNAGCVGFDPYYVGSNYKRRPYWDKDGEYVRQWCQELRSLPNWCEKKEAERGIGTFKHDCLYEPWAAPANILLEAGVSLGTTYPIRICDERESRKRFFEKIRKVRKSWPSSKMDERGRDIVHLRQGNELSEAIGMFTPQALLVNRNK